MARLAGARLVCAVETEDGKRFAESLVKALTGGDTITARFLHCEYFEFVPQFKLWLATNHKPTIRGDDHAIWRRIRLIPFGVTIPEAEQDGDLGAKLAEERAGILKWAIEGCLAWQRDGLQTPEPVRAATADYRADMDRLGQWIEERCVITSDREGAGRARVSRLSRVGRGSRRAPVDALDVRHPANRPWHPEAKRQNRLVRRHRPLRHLGDTCDTFTGYFFLRDRARRKTRKSIASVARCRRRTRTTTAAGRPGRDVERIGRSTEGGGCPGGIVSEPKRLPL